LRIEYIEAITHIHLGFEMRRLEVIVADLELLPEGQVRIRPYVLPFVRRLALDVTTRVARIGRAEPHTRRASHVAA
jgi:hypothetical protein